MNEKATAMIKLNIGGEKFSIPEEGIRTFCHPESRLSRLCEAETKDRRNFCDIYLADEDEFYFSRVFDYASPILRHIRYGRVVDFLCTYAHILPCPSNRLADHPARICERGTISN